MRVKIHTATIFNHKVFFSFIFSWTVVDESILVVWKHPLLSMAQFGDVLSLKRCEQYHCSSPLYPYPAEMSKRRGGGRVGVPKTENDHIRIKYYMLYITCIIIEHLKSYFFQFKTGRPSPPFQPNPVSVTDFKACVWLVIGLTIS